MSGKCIPLSAFWILAKGWKINEINIQSKKKINIDKVVKGKEGKMKLRMLGY